MMGYVQEQSLPRHVNGDHISYHFHEGGRPLSDYQAQLGGRDTNAEISCHHTACLPWTYSNTILGNPHKVLAGGLMRKELSLGGLERIAFLSNDAEVAGCQFLFDPR